MLFFKTGRRKRVAPHHQPTETQRSEKGELEKERFFGSETERSKITLLLVGDLDPELVISWVSAINPPDVVDRFIHWNADAPDDTSENGSHGR
jgi:hypothetical protein